MPRIRVWPYKQGSRSAKSLATALGGKVLKKQGSSYIPQVGDRIINWGDGTCPLTQCLNNPSAIQRASNKRTAFETMKEGGVQVPKFATTTGNVSWEGLTVCRHVLQGHSGQGIELANVGDLPSAPLYVQYIKKEEEYRVHCGKKASSDTPSIIAVQRKARRHDHPNPNWQVRNHDNGFVFVRGGFTAPQAVLDEASKALVALGLDFGAVDVIWNAKEGKAYVLEINTAPGLEGQTITDYANFFQS